MLISNRYRLIGLNTGLNIALGKREFGRYSLGSRNLAIKKIISWSRARKQDVENILLP